MTDNTRDTFTTRVPYKSATDADDPGLVVEFEYDDRFIKMADRLYGVTRAVMAGDRVTIHTDDPEPTLGRETPSDTDTFGSWNDDLDDATDDAFTLPDEPASATVLGHPLIEDRTRGPGFTVPTPPHRNRKEPGRVDAHRVVNTLAYLNEYGPTDTDDIGRACGDACPSMTYLVDLEYVDESDSSPREYSVTDRGRAFMKVALKDPGFDTADITWGMASSPAVNTSRTAATDGGEWRDDR